MHFVALLFSLSLACGSAKASWREAQKGNNDVDTGKMISAVHSVVTGIEATQRAAKDRSSTQKVACTSNETTLESAILKDHRVISQAAADLEAATADSSSLQESVDGLKHDIKSASEALDSLQERLNELRDSARQSEQETEESLQQLQEVIIKGEYGGQSQQHHHRRQHHLRLKNKISNLRTLAQELSVSEQPPSFIQLGRRGKLQNYGGDFHDVDQQQVEADKAAVLNAGAEAQQEELEDDREATAQAGNAVRAGIDEEEKKVLELIRITRDKLQKTEDNLKAKLPALADRLAGAADANRTLQGAQRSLYRDSKMLTVVKEKCAMMKVAGEKQLQQRAKVLQQLRMAVKMMQSMDPTMFLGRDIKVLSEDYENVQSFVQVSSKRDDEYGAGQDISLLGALHGSQEDVGLAQRASAVRSLGQSGPFDEVTHMIQGLISDLRSQANAEVDHHTFCMNSMGENRRSRVAKVDSIHMKQSEIRWGDAAIENLNDEVTFLDSELVRLSAGKKAAMAEALAETSRVEAEMAADAEYQNIITEVAVVLVHLCKLDPSVAQATPALLQFLGSHIRKSSRFNQCGEAVSFLNDATKQIADLDEILDSYKGQFGNMTESTITEMQNSIKSRTREKITAESVRATRAEEVAQAKTELKIASKELGLIQEAKTQLESECSPASQADIYSDRKADREKEIENLKEALRILDGESMPPIDGSLLEVVNPPQPKVRRLGKPSSVKRVQSFEESMEEILGPKPRF